ncbi:MAG: hypothetical protein NTU53_03995 [Planctomycetota bacterium]|nr:hypothetical protein [Planctomycetota bacterium]
MNTLNNKYRLMLGVILLAITAPPASAYILNPSDFAAEVVDYVEGNGMVRDYVTGEAFNNPANAIGRPTVDTTGDGFTIRLGETAPVVPIYGAFRSFELVTVGQGGQLTVKFDHRVTNDPRNPFGLDLIVFGNAAGVAQDYWTNRNPNALTVQDTLRAERGIVSVSQDGTTWHTFTNGPYADTFAPSLGRVYDPNHPDRSIGQWNQWWGLPTDPTKPLDPSITRLAFVGKTVAEVAQIYADSAGGTAFDIGTLGLDWIQYVRVENPLNSGLTPDIDAFADVAPVPEPSCVAVLAMAALAHCRRRKTAH